MVEDRRMQEIDSASLFPASAGLATMLMPA
jgi:hypothetical protein